MAAQERAKAAGNKLEPAPPKDLLDEELPPPAFDESILPPPNKEEQEPPPPPFQVLEQHDPPPAFETLEEPPAYEEMEDISPPAPMAPAYEELMDHHQESLDTIQPMQAPCIEHEDTLGIEGLSEEERRALIEEQRQIMAQIEQEQSANAAAIAAAAADNFDSRSAPAVAQAASEGVPALRENDSVRTLDLGGGQHVALHGQERTRAAIENGTAILVQCVHCQNWMQVTDTATLMFCPVCSVVSPVERQFAVLTKEEAMQLTADRRMAEQLQNEEFAARGDEEEEEEESWWDSITSVFRSKKSTPAPPRPHVGVVPQQVAPQHRGDIGVARPPGSPPRETTGLIAARTGEEETTTETITFSNSYEEREGLLMKSGNGGGGVQKARVAEPKPLFSCVVDSVSQAASSLGSALTTTTLQEDEEGNVHGVDASSLLAVPNVSRGEASDEYQPLRTDT